MNKAYCVECEAYESMENILICSDSNEYICAGCATTCDGCNKNFLHTASNYYNNYCASCQDYYIVCYRCDEIMHLDDSFSPSDVDGVYCEACAEGELTWCENCDRYYRYECCDDDGYDYNGIHDYGYRPDALFKSTDRDIEGKGPNPYRGLPYLGMELETEATNCTLSDGVEIANEHSRDESVYYLKSDGSLNYGFELVTHPMTLDWAMTKFPWQVVDELRKAGMRSYNTRSCGVHIHINRRAFASASHLWKFCYLINKNQSFSESIAGRRNNQFATFEGQVKQAGGVIAKKFPYQQQGRYTSINLTNHSTIEVRIFKGTLKVSRLKAYLQFVDAVYNYTKELSVKECLSGALRDVEFAQWTLLNRYKYSELCELKALEAFSYSLNLDPDNANEEVM